MKKLALIAAASTLFIAGTAFASDPSGNIQIINETESTLKLVNTYPPVQMDQWNFTDVTSDATFTIQFKNGWLTDPTKDKADARYVVTCPDGSEGVIDFAASWSDTGPRFEPVQQVIVNGSGSCISVSPNNQNVWNEGKTTQVFIR